MPLYLIRRRTPRSIYQHKVEILCDYVKNIATKVRNIPRLVLQHKQVQILEIALCMEAYTVAFSKGKTTIVIFIKMAILLGF